MRLRQSGMRIGDALHDRQRAMVASPTTVEIAPGGEVDRLLALAEESPVILEHNGVRFRLTRESADSPSGYDPERFREALRRYAGTLDPEEGERMKEMIYRAREEGTRPADRPRDF